MGVKEDVKLRLIGLKTLFKELPDDESRMKVASWVAGTAVAVGRGKLTPREIEAGLAFLTTILEMVKVGDDDTVREILREVKGG